VAPEAAPEPEPVAEPEPEPEPEPVPVVEPEPEAGPGEEELLEGMSDVFSSWAWQGEPVDRQTDRPQCDQPTVSRSRTVRRS